MEARTSNPELTVDVFHDERSAGFAALGAAMVSGLPSLVLCTSGTASAHLHASVIEADLSAVPMLVCTADRPPEMRDVGAPQTIDQTKLFGDAVRWFHDPGVADMASMVSWRSMAVRAYWSSVGDVHGPVHLNLPFREPLVGRPIVDLEHDLWGADPSPARERRRGQLILRSDAMDGLARDLSDRHGVIIAGRGCGDPVQVEELARALGWPVISEPRARCGGGSRTILHGDALLRVPEIADVLVPEVVVRIGEPPASKVLAQWVTATRARQIHVTGSGQSFDPDHRLSVRLEVDIESFLGDLSRRVSATADATWWKRWYESDLVVRRVLDDIEGDSRLWSGLTATRAIVKRIPQGSHLVVSSSMPIRDVEWFAGDCSHLYVHANRGANGIDGVIATAAGVARASGATTFALVGDVATIHDASTLLSLVGRDLDLRIVVVNNDGGGIFHHLPQASIVDERTFDILYGTPHGLDFAVIARSIGLPAHEVIGPENELVSKLTERGPSLLQVRTERHADLEAHRTIHERVAVALRSQARTSADNMA